MEDVVIRNARVVDGTGQPWFWGWVAVRGDRISGVGRGTPPAARRTIDAGGAVLAPGFIDIHTHSDDTILLYPEAESALLQGVTTHVGGNCGSSLAPAPARARERMMSRWKALGFLVQVSDRTADPHLLERLRPYLAGDGPVWETVGQFLDLVEQARPAINFGMFVGHGTVRLAVVGEEARAATPEELGEMERLVLQALDDGALGMSTGLIYAPGIHAPTEEIVALARAVASRGGIYASHIRGEGETLEEAVAEAIRVGREARVPVQISHHKATGEHNWGKTRGTLDMVDRARAEGVDVTLDQYPYTATSTGLTAFLPPWAHEGGMRALLERLADPEARRRMERDMREGLPGWTSPWRGVGFDRVLLVSVRGQPELNGLTVAEVARRRGVRDFDAVFDLLLEAEGAVHITRHALSEDDVRLVMRHPWVMVGSDGRATLLSGGREHPHPRSFGTFPRVLGHYCREQGVLRLEEAVRKMTGLPAWRLGWWDRGVIRPGAAADLTLFDPETVADTATFENPRQAPRGIRLVLVNGQVAVEDGRLTGVRAGRCLRRPR